MADLANSQIVQSTQSTVKSALFDGINYVDDTKVSRSMILKITLGAAIIVLLVFWSKISNVLSGTKSNDVSYLSPFEVHGSVTSDWVKSELSALLINLKKELDATHFSPLEDARCGLYQQVLALSNNQLIALGNTYKKRFSKSLLQHLSEQTLSGCGLYGSNYDELIQRLKKLNLA